MRPLQSVPTHGGQICRSSEPLLAIKEQDLFFCQDIGKQMKTHLHSQHTSIEAFMEAMQHKGAHCFGFSIASQLDFPAMSCLFLVSLAATSKIDISTSECMLDDDDDNKMQC